MRFHQNSIDVATTARQSDIWDRLTDFAAKRPGTVMLIVLVAHVIVWTLVPMSMSRNLQLDLAEGLALGREWQLGYWKHPPLPWWVTDLIYRITGQVRSVYVLGALASAISIWAVWLLAREIVPPVQALVSALALEGIHFYNYSAVKFAHDQMQLPIWALAALFLYRAIVRGHNISWILAGVMVALAFWTKYSALAFAVCLALIMFIDPYARRTWRTPGPYLMGAAFAISIAPHLIWLITHDFGPFVYVNARARMAEHWHEYFIFPLRWIGGQFAFLLPALALLAVALLPIRAQPKDDSHFARRYVTMLAIGPFSFVTLVAIFTGRLPVLMWGYPLWSFLPLAIVIWVGGHIGMRQQRAFAFCFVALFVTMPILYIAVTITDSFLGKMKATDFPGQVLAEKLTDIWHSKVGRALEYVTGDELAANNVAIFSRDRPRVIFNGMPERSPWLTKADLDRAGVLVVWTDGGSAPLDTWKVTFPKFDLNSSEILEIPLEGWSQRPPLRMRYVIMHPIM